jgi:hypothetical protein
MTNETAMEIFDQLFSLLEAQETQSAAMLQLIKDKGIASDAELAPYLDQAGNASSVRWRAARVRINYLLSSTKPAKKTEEKKESAHQDAAPVANKDNDNDKDEKQSKGQQPARQGQDQPESAAAATKNQETSSSGKAEQDKQKPRDDQASSGDERESEQHSKSQAG